MLTGDFCYDSLFTRQKVLDPLNLFHFSFFPPFVILATSIQKLKLSVLILGIGCSRTSSNGTCRVGKRWLERILSVLQRKQVGELCFLDTIYNSWIWVIFFSHAICCLPASTRWCVDEFLSPMKCDCPSVGYSLDGQYRCLLNYKCES